MKRGSVGLVETEHLLLPGEVALEHGGRLDEVSVAFEAYGRPNDERTNAVLVCHALSGDAHAAGLHPGEEKPGWWDMVIGPDKALDTNRYFVICSNVLGGCKGTTGPSSIEPRIGRPYGLRFPVISIRDMVEVQRRLLEGLGVRRLFAVVGGSFGGMQVLQWSISYPDMVRLAIPIATSASSSPQQIAFNEVGRRAIITDPDWGGGDYYGRRPPSHGLALARMIGHITYLSDEAMHHKFGRRLHDGGEDGFMTPTDFEVESYLRHHGDRFVKRFDANSYIYLTEAIDHFDLARGGSLSEAFREVKAKFLVLSISSDWLYPSYQSRELVEAMRANGLEVRNCQVSSSFGHDAFLIESEQMNYLIGSFLSRALVRDVMTKDPITIKLGSSVEEAARVMVEKEVTHLPVVAEDGRLAGIVTAWDVSKAVAMRYELLEEIMTRDVVISGLNDSIEGASKKMSLHNISALPVIDQDRKVLGMVSAEGLSRLVGICS